MFSFFAAYLALVFSCNDSNVFNAGGAGGTDETGTNKDTHQLPVISMGTLIDVPASLFMSIFCNGTWLTQEPPCRFQTICFQFLVLHGFRNLLRWERFGFV